MREREKGQKGFENLCFRGKVKGRVANDAFHVPHHYDRKEKQESCHIT